MSQWNALLDATRGLAKALRDHYLEESSPRIEPYDQPPEIVLDEPLGPWPEFILYTVPCVRSDVGNCSPCFYSRVQPIRTNHGRLYQSLLQQLNYVLAGFDDLVLARQTRQVAYPQFAKWRDRRPVMMGLAMTGSILSDQEIPQAYREAIFKQVVEFADSRQIVVQLFIETHAHDVVRLRNTGELETLAKILSPLSIVNLMGFESASDLVREALYCKGLSLHEFETAVSASKEYGFIPGAFVFAGLHSMTQSEALEDVRATLKYLRDLDVVPVLMLPHLQPYTINHLLYTYGRYEILELRTIAGMVETLLADFSPCSQSQTDPWLMGLEGGPPEPQGGVFQNPNRITCDSCASILKTALRTLRRTYDYAAYRLSVAPLEACSCRLQYEEHLRLQAASVRGLTLVERAQRDVDFATQMKDAYLSQLGKHSDDGISGC